MQRATPPVLVYDGSCGFCTRSAIWLSRHVAADSIVLCASQAMSSEDFAALGLDQIEASASVWWIDGEIRRNGHAAISAALKSCHWCWRPLGMLMDLAPFRWIGPLIYRLVARNRHRLPGATAACRVAESQKPDIQKNAKDP